MPLLKDFTAWLQASLPICALVIAIFALLVSFFSWPENRDRIYPGEVRLLPPLAGYAVYRGVLAFPSDHLAIPMTWRNSTNHPVVVSDPRLVLSEKGKTHYLLMYEELPGFSDTAIQQYTHTNWMVLPPHSVSTHIGVFGTQQRWDKTHTDYRFRFRRDTGTDPEAALEYLLTDRSSFSRKSTVLIGPLPLYPGITEIQDHGYDFFWIRHPS